MSRLVIFCVKRHIIVDFTRTKRNILGELVTFFYVVKTLLEKIIIKKPNQILKKKRLRCKMLMFIGLI